MGGLQRGRDSASCLGENPSAQALGRAGHTTAVGQRLLGESCDAEAWSVGTLYRQPCGSGPVNTKRGDRAGREFFEPVLHGPVEGVVRGNNIPAAF